MAEWKDDLAPFSDRELLLMASVARDWRTRLAALEAELRSQERSVRFSASHRARIRRLLDGLPEPLLTGMHPPGYVRPDGTTALHP